MSEMITTHVLDTANGRPAEGVAVILEMRQTSTWSLIGRGVTDANGRLGTLTQDHAPAPGIYRLTFDTGRGIRTPDGDGVRTSVGIGEGPERSPPLPRPSR